MKVIYKKPDVPAEKTQHYRGNIHAFMPVFDSTDLFNWACIECRYIVDVLLVKREDRYTHSPTVYFVLECKRCGNQGFRKICLGINDKHSQVIPAKISFLTRTPTETKQGIQKEERGDA